MSYLFKGRLCSYICSECSNPLRNVKVRLYRTDGRDDVIDRAVANAKDTFIILDDRAIEAKQSLLIAEAVTDAEGNYSFELSEEQRYDGGAFEIDVYVDSAGDERRAKAQNPVQFSITVLKPQWRAFDDRLIWGWDYCLPYRWWCMILARLGVWVICGRVVLCRDRKVGFPDVKVTAFDRDWLQDDDLGSATTDGNGYFRIYYTYKQFKPGLLWNVEFGGGPDLYFKVDSSIGVPILVEDQERGRAPDRENVGNCFCVTLCVDRENPPKPPQTEPHPDFTRIGDYKFSSEIHSAPTGTGLTKGNGSAFYSTIRLNGQLSRTLNKNPLEYRFEVAELNPAGNPIAWLPVKKEQIADTIIGELQKNNPAFGPPGEDAYLYSDCHTHGAADPDFLALWTHDAFGDWIQVPQATDSSTVGFFMPNGNMINLITTSFAPEVTVDLTTPTVLVAGNSVTSTGKALAVNKHFAIQMFVREVESGVSGASAGLCENVAIENSHYHTLNHPSWMAAEGSGNGVGMIDIKQLIDAGCSGIVDKLDILITAAHPNFGGASVNMEGPDGPYPQTKFNMPAVAASGKEQSGTVTPNGFSVAGLRNCAYIVNLGVTLLLTNGDDAHPGMHDHIAFCKKDSTI